MYEADSVIWNMYGADSIWAAVTNPYKNLHTHTQKKNRSILR